MVEPTAVLLDTHVLIWLMEQDPRLGPRSRDLADAALRRDLLNVSAIAFWETAMLGSRDRIELTVPVAGWRGRVLRVGIGEWPLTGSIAMESVSLEGLHPDPADRFTMATAIHHGATLITADARILAWEGSMSRHDARR